LRLPRNLSSNNVAVARNCCLCFRTIITASFSCLFCSSLDFPSTTFSACRTATINEEVKERNDRLTFFIGPSFFDAGGPPPESMEDVDVDVDDVCRVAIFCYFIAFVGVP
jgi:hypothetical protein